MPPSPSWLAYDMTTNTALSLSGRDLTPWNDDKPWSRLCLDPYVVGFKTAFPEELIENLILEVFMPDSTTHLCVPRILKELKKTQRSLD